MFESADHLGNYGQEAYIQKMFESAEQFGNDGQEAYVQNKKESKYKAADLQEVVENHHTLNPREKELFYEILKRVKKLFLGTKGKCKGAKIAIELIEGAMPV